MTKQEDFSFLENASTAIEQLQKACDLYRSKHDICIPEEYQKIYQFEDKFNKRYETIQSKLNSLKHFIEKSFAPTEEELIQEKAHENLLNTYPSYDLWDEEAKKAVLEAEIKRLTAERNAPKTKKPKEPKGENYESSCSIENPNPEKIYYINDDFTHCKPAAVKMFDEIFEVSSWRETLQVIGQFLYETDQQPVINYLKKAPEKNAFFTKTPNEGDQVIEITNGIYIRTNFSTKNLMKSCQKLLYFYNADIKFVKIYLSRIAK